MIKITNEIRFAVLLGEAAILFTGGMYTLCLTFLSQAEIYAKTPKQKAEVESIRMKAERSRETCYDR